MLTTIEVTQEHIGNGVYTEGEDNPFARAITAKLREGCDATVYAEYVYFWDETPVAVDISFLPYEAMMWDGAEPFTFQLEIPDELLATPPTGAE